MKLKFLKGANHGGSILVDAVGTNSISFCADMPKCAAVDRIRISGEFAVNGVTHKNVYLEDIWATKVITYHKEMAEKAFNPERMQRVIATVHFPEGVPADLLTKVQNYIITDFDVLYHNEYIAETE